MQDHHGKTVAKGEGHQRLAIAMHKHDLAGGGAAGGKAGITRDTTQHAEHRPLAELLHHHGYEGPKMSDTGTAVFLNEREPKRHVVSVSNYKRGGEEWTHTHQSKHTHGTNKADLEKHLAKVHSSQHAEQNTQEPSARRASISAGVQLMGGVAPVLGARMRTRVRTQSSQHSEEGQEENPHLQLHYHVFMKGGSVGSTKGVRHFQHGAYVSSHATKEHADDKAKRMNKILTPGEKGYYKMKYHVKHTDQLGKFKVPGEV